MATLLQFLSSGTLGPISLGIEVNDALDILGSPDAMSKKANPFFCSYGAATLIFLRATGATHKRALSELVIEANEKWISMNPQLRFVDFKLWPAPSRKKFDAYLDESNQKPVAEGARDAGTIVFMSGVAAKFEHEQLTELRLSARRPVTSRSAILSSDRESDLEDVRAYLFEAHQALNAGLLRAGLLVLWAALESTLRHLVEMSSVSVRTMNPAELVRAVALGGLISKQEQLTLENARQARMAAAHGLKGMNFTPDDLHALLTMAHKLVDRAALGKRPS